MFPLTCLQVMQEELETCCVMKIGHTTTCLRTMWKHYFEHPGRTHPPAELISSELMKDAFRSVISIVTNCDVSQDFANLHVNKNVTVALSSKYFFHAVKT